MESQLIIDEEEAIKAVLEAGKGLRLINFIIDYFAIGSIFILSSSYYQFLYFNSDSLFLEELNLFLIFELIYFTYYFLLEWITNGKTLGKLITTTRSVKEYGEHCTIADFAKRSLARCIPFEALTIFGTQVFHDYTVSMIVIKERKVSTTFYN
ncbi:MAG: RDD family protein [bacterium]|nr:RDD family protein [bacterium]